MNTAQSRPIPGDNRRLILVPPAKVRPIRERLKGLKIGHYHELQGSMIALHFGKGQDMAQIQAIVDSA